MSKASLTTIEHEVDEADMADAQFTGYYIDAALAEAKMLVERNDRGWYCSPWERHNATCALAEALAAFVAE